ncbi:hypothetical protein [Candidatus Bathycorpusculum sp.]|jgi:hypothetical protein
MIKRVKKQKGEKTVEKAGNHMLMLIAGRALLIYSDTSELPK